MRQDYSFLFICPWGSQCNERRRELRASGALKDFWLGEKPFCGPTSRDTTCPDHSCWWLLNQYLSRWANASPKVVLNIFFLYFLSFSPTLMLPTEQFTTRSLPVFLGDCKTCGLHLFRPMRLLVVSDKWWVIIFHQVYCLTFTKHGENAWCF